MTRICKVGIIGAGGIAALSHLPEIAEIPDMQVTHICGRTESRLKLLCERFSIPKYSLNWDDLLRDATLDAIIVALPHPLHAQAGIAVLKAGKHLFMQKPLCASLAEADQLVALAEKHSNLAVYCRPSFGPEIYEMRRLIATGAIGTITSASARVSHGGPEVYYAEVADAFEEPRRLDDLWFFDADQAGVGALFDMGVYAVANLVAVLGRVNGVTACLSTVAKPTELEDTAMMILDCDNGVLASAVTSWCDPARTASLRVHGTEGKLEWNVDGAGSLVKTSPGSSDREFAPPIVEMLHVPSTINQHVEWMQSMETGAPPVISNIWTARHVTEILLAAQHATQPTSVSIQSSPRIEK